jgi:UDP-GlcNAc:undecaprenyl-phosphate GlcNAc-1-phosphate transferase
MFLGFVLATTSMMGASIQGSTTVAILVPLISLGVPIMDTLFAMVRRIVERRPIFSPDRGHIHHRLLDLGITHRRAVLILYAVSVVFTAGAITIALGRNWSVGVALLVLTVAMLGLARFVGYFEYLQIRRRQKQHIHSRGTERLRVAVPELIRALEDVDRADIPAMLERFASVAELLEIELEPAGGEPMRALPAVRWAANEAAYPNGAREPVRASFEVASARAKLKVAWLSDDGDVSPQADILLQIAADALERRVKASLPAPAPVAAEAMEREVVEHLRDSRPA